MSSASCLVCNTKCIASLAERLLLIELWKSKATRYLERACMFYTEATLISAHEKNVAYTLLISALECLAASQDYPSSETIDADDLVLLEKIRSSSEFGAKPYDRLKSRFHQLKKKCVKVVEEFFRSEIYKHVGAQDGFKIGNRRVPDSKRSAGIAASYDLRSEFIHSGADHSFITADWWRSDFSNVKSMLKQNLRGSCLQNSLNIYQLDGIVQHCLSSAISKIVMRDEFLPSTAEISHKALEQSFRTPLRGNDSAGGTPSSSLPSAIG
jgi:hypothetical protein